MSTTTEPAALDAATKKLLTALIIGGVAAILDTTIVAVGLHSLVSALDTSVSTVQWVSTGYLLALAVAIPIVGWGQARIGAKRLWLVALSLFLLGSVLCACAWDAQSLIAFRVVQGLGGGMLFPLLQTIAMQKIPGGASGRILATVSLPTALGPILGPIVGGVILNWLSWHWLFLVNVPICLVGLALAVAWVPSDPPRAERRPFRLDVVGLVLIAPALVGVLYGLSRVATDGGFGSTDVLLPLVGGVVLLAAFVLWAIRAAARRVRPLVDVRMLRVKTVRASSWCLALMGAGLYGGMFVLPLYFQTLRGQDALGAALLLIPQGVGSLLSRTIAGRLTDAIGARAVAVGAFALTTLATIPFALAGPHTNQWWLGAVLLVRGLGLGGVLVPVMASGFIGLDKASVPDASMVTRIAQQLGGSFGTAIVAVVLENGLQSGDPTSAFHQSFWWAVGISIVATALAFTLPGRAVPADAPQA